jgi:predicted outer membrane repeat protein
VGEHLPADEISKGSKMRKSSVNFVAISILVLTVIALSPGLFAASILVPDEQPTIQAGVNAASNGDTVQVAAGTYTSSGNWDINPVGKTLVIRAVDGPSLTVIDCGSGLGQAHSAFVVNGTTADLTVEGFSIQSSLIEGVEVDTAAVTLKNCRFEFFPPPPDNFTTPGRALSSLRGPVTMINCVVDSMPERSRIWGARVSIDGCTFKNNLKGVLQISNADTAVIRNSLFRDNDAYLGAGVLVDRTYMEIDSCVFEGNNSPGGGGGAVYTGQVELVIKNSWFLGNSGLDGGALAIHGNSKLISTGNVFARNVSDRGASAIVVTSSSYMELDHCTLFNNTVIDTIFFPGCQIGLSESFTNDTTRADIHHSIIAFAESGRAVLCIDGSNEVDMDEWTTWECSNLFGNAGGDFLGTLAANYQDSDNFSVDPKFCDTLTNNLSLSIESPMLPLANVCNELIGALGPDDCECCVEIAGNVDGDPAQVIDIGDLTALISYLYINGAPPVCTQEGNVDGDPGMVVDIGDLTAMIAYLYIPPNPLPAACP